MAGKTIVNVTAPRGLRMDQAMDFRKRLVSLSFCKPDRHHLWWLLIPDGNHLAANTGVTVSARTKEDTSMATTDTAIEPRKSPAAPGRSTKGMKANTVVNVEDRSGTRIRRIAAFIASRGFSPPINRLRISSVITIELSTSNPNATTNPVTDIC